jgi:DNA-binding NarL/FixJ family response regulator
MTERAHAPVGFKVLVVGSDGALRRGIVQFLRTINISPWVGEATFESVLTAMLGDFDWDLVALDLEGGSDLTILKRISEIQPGIPMLVLTADDTPAAVKAAFAAGASGCLGKSSPVQAWSDAFETVAAGGRYPPIHDAR